MQCERSFNKNATACATSSGVPARFTGMLEMSCSLSSFVRWSFMFVEMKPGLTPFTETPHDATSLASDFTKLFCAPLTVEYMTSWLAPTCPHIDDIKIMCPVLLLIIEGNNAFVICKGAVTCRDIS